MIGRKVASIESRSDCIYLRMFCDRDRGMIGRKVASIESRSDCIYLRMFCDRDRGMIGRKVASIESRSDCIYLRMFCDRDRGMIGRKVAKARFGEPDLLETGVKLRLLGSGATGGGKSVHNNGVFPQDVRPIARAMPRNVGTLE